MRLKHLTWAVLLCALTRGHGQLQTNYVPLTWNAPTVSVDPVYGYNVYRLNQSTGLNQLLNLNPIFTTNYTDATVIDGQSYQYYVKSVDVNGIESISSNVAFVSVPQSLFQPQNFVGILH